MISHHARSPSLHSYLFYCLNLSSLMANNCLTIDFKGLVEADSRRANAGDVKKINKRDDLMISHQARSPSLHSYLFYCLNPPSLMANGALLIFLDTYRPISYLLFFSVFLA